jgi:hypothetical protein
MEEEGSRMQMTRRAFLTNPLRSFRTDMEHAGAWLSRARVKRDVTAAGDDGADATKGQVIPTAARGVGLRQARENMGRSEHEQL